MHVVFRADASTRIGTGHVMRCLTLAESLRRAGDTVRFVSRERPGHLCNVVERRGIPVHRLPAAEAGESHGWLGVEWSRDARETRDAMAGGPHADWLVTDHYGVDERWERTLRDTAGSVLAIDDLADRRHACDALLDQNLVADAEGRYDGLVPRYCRTLLGPRYALLQPEYAKLRANAHPRRGAIRRVLLFFGGADLTDLTARGIRAFLSLGRRDVTLDVVLPDSASPAASARMLAQGHENVVLHERLPTLAPLMQRADLAIGGGGATSWERLCLGLPALVVTLADNQRAIAEELHRRRLVEWLGHENEVDERLLAQALQAQLERGADEEWSSRALAAVDGQGTQRVVEALRSSDVGLRARNVTADDEQLLLDWANDTETRRNAFTQDPIAPDVHHRWLTERLRRGEDCRFYIVETSGGTPVGQVRFDRVGDRWVVSYSIARAHRGKGMGRRVLAVALAQLHATGGPGAVEGHVKPDNAPSHTVFRSLGFAPLPAPDAQGATIYRRHIGNDTQVST